MQPNAEQNLNIHIFVNDLPIAAQEGQSLAAALIAAGKYVFRHSGADHPRGLFCGMGVCFECLVTVDGQPEQRACILPVSQGMQVQLPMEQNDVED